MCTRFTRTLSLILSVGLMTGCVGWHRVGFTPTTVVAAGHDPIRLVARGVTEKITVPDPRIGRDSIAVMSGQCRAIGDRFNRRHICPTEGGGTLAMIPRPTSRQEAAQPSTGVPAATVQAEGGSSFWGAVVGSRSERTRLVFGLWVLHPYDPEFPEVEWTQGFALQVDQWFAATFINSYDDRSFIAGLERNWATAQTPVARFGIGYRVGLLTGYDERLMPIAEHTPVLPFVGILLWTDVGPFGLDVYYVYEAISLETAIRF